MTQLQPVSNKSLKSQNTVGVILAAGLGKRMKNDLPKVAHTILGKPLVQWAVDSLLHAGINKLVVVISPGQPVVEQILQKIVMPQGTSLKIAYQEVAQGTAHAAACALPAARELLHAADVPTKDAHIIIGFGDTPAVSSESFSRYLEHHIESGNAFSVLAFESLNPSGYGRVVMDQGIFREIREDKDCNEKERTITLCNSGFLCARFAEFEHFIPLVKTNNAAKEYYLTDLPKLAVQSQKLVGVFSDVVQEELEGVNSQSQLASMARYLQNRIISNWQDKGVQFLDPHSVYIEEGITFDPGVIVEPFVFLAGKSHFAAGTRIASFSRMIDGKRT